MSIIADSERSTPVMPWNFLIELLQREAFSSPLWHAGQRRVGGEWVPEPSHLLHCRVNFDIRIAQTRAIGTGIEVNRSAAAPRQNLLKVADGRINVGTAPASPER